MYTLVLSLVLSFNFGPLPITWIIPNLTKEQCLTQAYTSQMMSGVDIPKESYTAGAICVDGEGNKLKLPPVKST